MNEKNSVQHISTSPANTIISINSSEDKSEIHGEDNILFRVKKLGWTVVEENDEFVKLGNASPMGQSFEIIVRKDDEDNNDESFIQNLLFVYNNFFAEDVAHIFIEKTEDDDTECYPSITRSAMELMNSMAACRGMVSNLCTDLIHSKKENKNGIYILQQM